MAKPTKLPKTYKLSAEREARLKIAKFSEYMNHPFFPPHLRKEYEEKIKSLRPVAYGNSR